MNKTVLAKIKKCLALARSANEHEAAAALAKARELMDQHGIDEEDIGLGDVADVFCEGWASGAFQAIVQLVPKAEPGAIVERYLEKEYPHAKPVDSRAAKAKRADNDFHNGYDGGRKANLHQAVGGGTAAPLALT